MRGVWWYTMRWAKVSPLHTFSFALFRVQPAVSRTLLVPCLPHHGYRSRWYASLTLRSTLGIAVKTIETHRASVIRKLNLKSTASPVRYAMHNKFVEDLTHHGCFGPCVDVYGPRPIATH